MRSLSSTFRARPLRLLRAAAHDQRGVSAITVAIALAVLAPMALGVFDVFTMNEQRGKLQDALDAAALYAARSPYVTTPQIDAVGDKALLANLQMIRGAKLKSSDFTLVGDKVVAQASVSLPQYSPAVLTQNPVQVTAEVTRAGDNLEVALVLDNSNSMGGQRLTDLKAAANQLVDLVVSDAQTPYYSKVSIVPYANAVNVGGYAVAARGATQPGANAAAGANSSPPSDSFFFHNASGQNRTFPVSTCVSERSGAEAFTDAPPSVSPLGLNYPAPDNACLSATLAPLSSDKSAIHASIAGLSACCSTGGQIGIAWGWYTLSPRWNAVFSGASAPAAYGSTRLIKALVLMTDGEYNSVYCKGVIAQSSTTGSGAAGDHINCDAPNGGAYAQAQALCSAMKAAPYKVVIYTVGFDVLNTPAAQDLVNNCATDAQHVYLPADGASLQAAFQQIAADLNRLRISH